MRRDYRNRPVLGAEAIPLGNESDPIARSARLVLAFVRVLKRLRFDDREGSWDCMGSTCLCDGFGGQQRQRREPSRASYSASDIEKHDGSGSEGPAPSENLTSAWNKAGRAANETDIR
jgi:hypothetical protein